MSVSLKFLLTSPGTLAHRSGKTKTSYEKALKQFKTLQTQDYICNSFS